MTTFGISVALLTPFDATGDVDGSRLASHAARLMQRGANGVTLFGTTGEGASVGLSERPAVLSAFRAAAIDPKRVTMGLCATSVADTLAQAHQAHEAGIRSFLLTPPFYFEPDAEGLYDWHAAVLAQVPEGSRAILYHIPQVTNVPLPLPLIARLRAAFGDRVRGVKDSSGDPANARALLQMRGGLEILIGDERRLHEAARLGCAGAISGMANLHPARMSRILREAREDAALSADVGEIVARPVVPALKAALSATDPAWARIRPPLAPLPEAEAEALRAALAVEPANG
ncbi:dihydrodipicolinate synthase family protein [Jannaschia seosinensis]|nr:dihydrodipicolinate synthase family protein [Jannaschia seosinensis]